MSSTIDDELPEEANIWQLNRAVYEAASQLAPRHRCNAMKGVEKIKRHVQKVEVRIKSARQHASRIQSKAVYIDNLAYSSWTETPTPIQIRLDYY